MFILSENSFKFHFVVRTKWMDGWSVSWPNALISSNRVQFSKNCELPAPLQLQLLVIIIFIASKTGYKIDRGINNRSLQIDSFIHSFISNFNPVSIFSIAAAANPESAWRNRWQACHMDLVIIINNRYNRSSSSRPFLIILFDSN